MTDNDITVEIPDDVPDHVDCARCAKESPDSVTPAVRFVRYRMGADVSAASSVCDPHLHADRQTCRRSKGRIVLYESGPLKTPATG